MVTYAISIVAVVVAIFMLAGWAYRIWPKAYVEAMWVGFFGAMIVDALWHHQWLTVILLFLFGRYLAVPEFDRERQKHDWPGSQP